MGIPKCPTGIAGLDAVTGGGVPRGRPTLVCGGPGCGKSLLALEFIVRGANEIGEPGVFVSFEETIDELDQNVASLGFDLPAMRERGLLYMDHISLARGEIEESGEYDLDGLFVRLAHAIDAVGARRIAVDTIEALFANLPNESILRSELVRLFRWLKERGVTAIITGEKGDGSLTRYGLEEYVSDCVLFLDHRLRSHVSTRHLRVVKYRGSAHGTNEYPFSIDTSGIEVHPVSSLTLDYEVQDERTSTGVEDLDRMLAGGVHRGSTTLVSGTTGTGKTILASHFVAAACAAGERALLVSFEESAAQIRRNVASIGLDLKQWCDAGRLRIESLRPQFLGLEQHLLHVQRLIEEHRPTAIALDPLSALLAIGDPVDTHIALLRLIDQIKCRGITALLTTLTRAGHLEATEVRVSSMADTWIVLRNVELRGERNRAIYALKARGTNHSNQMREFVITPAGVSIIDAYTGPGEVLTGSARVAPQADPRDARDQLEAESRRLQRRLQHERAAFEARQAALRAEFANVQEEIEIEFDIGMTRATGLRGSQDRGTQSKDRAAQSQDRAAQSQERGAQSQERGTQDRGSRMSDNHREAP